jgi:hypothetical protein
MRKTVFLCVANALLFVLVGLAFLYPASEVIQSQTPPGLEFRPTIFPLLLAVYLVVYPATCFILAKKYRWRKQADSELTYADEREKTIVAESTKVAYKVLIGGLIVIIPTIGGVRFFSLFSGMDLGIYPTSIALLAALLVVATISYCVKWCLEYRE